MGRRHRLRHARDVAHVRREGQSRRHPLAILLFAPNGRPESRFAYSASARVGKAHIRNRAKRLLRECVRGHLSEVAPGWDCLFIVRTQTAEASLSEVEEAVLQLLRRANLLQLSGEPAARQG